MMPKLTRGPQNILWSFNIREMFTPLAYRDDGLGGAKTRISLFPIAAASAFDMPALHGEWVRRLSAFEPQGADLDVYDLRMATPERRRHRKLTHAAVDPERHMQLLGHDCLDDERGMVLKTIPPERRFQPPFLEDGGLWAVPAVPTKRMIPDHDRARLMYVERMRVTRGGKAALHVMRDLVDSKAGDTDLSEVTARLAPEAGQPDLAIDITNATLTAEPDQAHALVTQALAFMMSGRDVDAAASLTRALEIVPESMWLRHLAAASQRGHDALTDAGAAWRRWAKGDAHLHEGAKVGQGDPAIIVIGYRTQPELIHAVESALLQGEVVDVVVVNSGGGPMRLLLAPWLDRIRLIEVQGRLRVGAARNIGIDASRARFVSFLAGDCRTPPGGALAVASDVVAEDTRNLSSAASAFIHHRKRHPRTSPDMALRDGLSTARVLVAMVGWFPPDMVLGEDTAFNALVSRSFPLEWSPDVVMTQRCRSGCRSRSPSAASSSEGSLHRTRPCRPCQGAQGDVRRLFKAACKSQCPSCQICRPRKDGAPSRLPPAASPKEWATPKETSAEASRARVDGRHDQVRHIRLRNKTGRAPTDKALPTETKLPCKCMLAFF